MRLRRRHLLAAGAAACLVALGLGWALSERGFDVSGCAQLDRPPRAHPDYADAVIPPNIAPLNFRVDEPGTRYLARFSSARGGTIEVRSHTPSIVIPGAAWKRLLAANRGEQLKCDVCVRASDGRWERFHETACTIAREEIDPYIVYRLIDPIVRLWRVIEIRQRSLETYDDSLVIGNGSFDEGCINCHTFLKGDPSRMTLQIRPGQKDYGTGMVMVDGERATKLDARPGAQSGAPVYVAGHPSGKALACSVNKVRQLVHSARAEVRDVLDIESSLAVYLTDSGTVVTTPALARPDRLATWPAWSADGKYLYYCSAPVLWEKGEQGPTVARFREVKYDLMRIPFDLDTATWGEPETVLAAKDTGLSIAEPRISPDGRFLAFCMSDYGCFPIYQASADLYMLDLQTGKYRKLAVNSDRTESWHSWSSNGRWLVFSSKRDNGLLARPYFTYVDEAGEAHKPFVLPQKDPTLYDSFIQTYNVPELVRGRMSASPGTLARAIRSDDWVRARAAGGGPAAAPQAGAGEEAGAAEPWTTAPR